MESAIVGNQDRSILDCLPLEVITQHVLTRVAACSSDDIFSVKLSCKTLCAVSEAPSILKSVSLNKFDRFSQTLHGQSFLERCIIAGNPEALYLTGMIQYFKMDSTYGLECLHRAMESGNLDSTYAIGIILILQQNEADEKKGMQIIIDLVKVYQRTVKFEGLRHNFLRRISWLNRTFIVGREMPRCCTKHPIRDSGWEKFEDVELDCHQCRCQQEIVHLWNHLPNTI